jgi:ABC-2 type transport system ATP-binding protein
MTMEPILELRHVGKQFKGFALRDISFALPKGYIMGFIGPNGAGKSTTIRCIMDLVHIDTGEVQLFGRPFRRDGVALKQRIGFVYDQDVFYSHLTAEKNKQVIAPFYTRWDDSRFYRYAKLFGLPLDKKMKDLSKGTKMKFALAVALSHHAELIIMDEPTSGLDPVFRRELLDLLMDVIQNGETSVFFSTHITSDLEKVADYLTFILDGRIIFSKPADELAESYMLVKGPQGDEAAVQVARPIYLKQGPLGFEAFMTRTEAERLPDNKRLHLERPDLEEIMYYIVQAQRQPQTEG